MTAKKISVYADGSSGGSAKGPCGWAYIVTDWENILGTGMGSEAIGTNNFAELRGGLDGLSFVYEKGLHVGNVVELVSDSMYTLGIASGEFNPIKNLELAAKIKELATLTNARTRWVRGHSGDGFNEMCDKMAKHAKNKISPEKELKRRKKKKDLKLLKRALIKEYKNGKRSLAEAEGLGAREDRLTEKAPSDENKE